MTAAERQPIHALTLAEVEARLLGAGQPKYRAGQVAQWLYAQRARSFAEMSNLPAALRTQLGEEFLFQELEQVRVLGLRTPRGSISFASPMGR